jgi:hypothetical protein
MEFLNPLLSWYLPPSSGLKNPSDIGRILQSAGDTRRVAMLKEGHGERLRR